MVALRNDAAGAAAIARVLPVVDAGQAGTSYFSDLRLATEQADDGEGGFEQRCAAGAFHSATISFFLNSLSSAISENPNCSRFRNPGKQAMDLIGQIKEGLKKPGKSKKGLAEALGRVPGTVTAILKGERQIKAKELPVISRYLELDATLGRNISSSTLTSSKHPVVSSYDPDNDESDQNPHAAVFEGGAHHIPEGEIPQVSAHLGLGHSLDAPLIEVPVGGGSVAAMEVVSTWKIPENILRRRIAGTIKNIHILECLGDSMYPKICDGDFALIDTAQRTPSPPGVFALWDGYGQTLKNIEIIMNSDPPRVRIVPENPKYSIYERELEEVSIIGRYIGRLTMG